MNTAKLISIIIPVYNGERYIDGLMRQLSLSAEDSDIELIFVDDGSRDRSPEILRAYEDGNRIITLRQENRGVSAARNTGLRRAQGEYIGFIDVDDVVPAGYLPAIRRLLADNCEADLIYFRAGRIRETEIGNKTKENCSDIPRAALIEQEVLLNRVLYNPTEFGVYNLLVKNTLIDKAGLDFAEGYKHYEDYDFIIRAVGNARVIRYSDDILYYYVQREGSAVGAMRPERITNIPLIDQSVRSVQADGVDKGAWAGCFKARLYWSVLWQSVFGLPGYRYFRKYADNTFAGIYMKQAALHPDRKVRLSSRLYNAFPFLYYLAVQLSGRGHSKIRVLEGEDLKRVMTVRGADPKRILLYGMTHNPGGIESYVMGIFRRQPADTFDFLCDFPKIAYEDELRGRGAEIHFVPAKSRNLFRHLLGIYRILRDHPEYRTVYMNVLDAGCAVTALMPSLMGRRVVVHSHNSDTDKVRLHRICKPWLNRIINGSAACSRVAAEYMFSGRNLEQALMIPNMIDTAKFCYDQDVRNEVRAELGIAQDTKVLLHVGRITRQKNPLFLIDVYDALHRKDDNWILISVGTGDMNETFLRYIRRKKLQEKVLVLGVRNDVDRIMQSADAFILPSLYEGFTIVGIEAQAADLPCFFSDKITSETKLCDKVYFVPLSESPEYWAGVIEDRMSRLQAEQGGIKSREEHRGAIQVEAAGYDIKSASEYDRKLMQLLKAAQ